MATELEDLALDIILVKNNNNGKHGGFRVGLLDRPLTNLEKDHFVCTVCAGILREPVFVGNSLKCKSCLQPGETARQAENISLEKLKVNCPYKEIGCTWNGSITHIIDHKNDCKDFLQKFPNNPELDIECSFKHYGCQVVTKRKYMDKHEQDFHTKHLKMMDKNIRNTEEDMKKLKSELGKVTTQLKLVEKEIKHTFGGINCELKGLRGKMKSNQSYRMQEFYVGLYHFQVTIHPNYNNENKMAIFIKKVRGIFDDRIVWPFNGKATFTLLNKVNEDNSIHVFTKVESKLDSLERHDYKGNGIYLATHETLLKEEYSKDDSIQIQVLVQFDTLSSTIN